MTMDQVIRLRVGSAHAEREEQFPLPAGWRATVYPPRDGPSLSTDEIGAAFAQPVGADPICRSASGARHAAILVDDFRRPTPAEPLCLAVIEQLLAAGLAKEQITIILGNGAHRPMTDSEIDARLGAARRCVGSVISHDAFSPEVKFLGLTPAGTPVLVNGAAVAADFSVSISTVYPHALVGWGGGAKMVLPGISHVSTIHYHHVKVAAGPWAGPPGDCTSRSDVEAAARLFGLNACVCAVMSSDRELCGLSVGDPVLAHRRAVELVRETSDTPVSGEPPDLVIANTYPFDGDGTQWSKAQAPVKQFGCPVLLINDFADPSTYHGLYDGPLDEYIRREQPQPPPRTDEQLMQARMFIYSPQYGDGFIPQDRSWYGDNDWERLMEAMSRRFGRAAVAVFPAAPLQIPRVT